jgi:ABC-type uncharacterized transport system permease subunit
MGLMTPIGFSGVKWDIKRKWVQSCFKVFGNYICLTALLQCIKTAHAFLLDQNKLNIIIISFYSTLTSLILNIFIFSFLLSCIAFMNEKRMPKLMSLITQLQATQVTKALRPAPYMRS